MVLIRSGSTISLVRLMQKRIALLATPNVCVIKRVIFSTKNMMLN